MPRKAEGLVKITCRIKEDDKVFLERFFAQTGYQVGLRKIIEKFCAAQRESENQLQGQDKITLP